MPRIIVKCHYYKNVSSRKSMGGYLNYIAKREGVEPLKDEWKNAPVTERQNELIQTIITKLPSVKKSSQYTDLQYAQTRSNASEFISHCVELHPQLLQEDSYLRYMATRPRTEKAYGSHGLFSDSDKPLDLESEVKALESFDGNVFTVIVSLKREDASRLGYDNANRWRDFIRANIDMIAEQYGIPKQHLKWYGAFHNESHHPHIHLLLYSTDQDHPGYIRLNGINKMRSSFGTMIFQDDLREIYDRQTKLRNQITDTMREEFKSLLDSVKNGSVLDDSFLLKFEELALHLNECKGKKVYGYLPKGVKSLVDELVDEVSVDENVQSLYDFWYRAKCSVFETYTDTMPEKLALSKEKAFKAVRNALVYEASRLGYELSRRDSISGIDIRSGAKKASSTGNKTNGTYHNRIVISAAMRFAGSLSQVFYDNYKKYDPEEDDIDKQLRREIWAVKNGQNLVM